MHYNPFAYHFFAHDVVDQKKRKSCQMPILWKFSCSKRMIKTLEQNLWMLLLCVSCWLLTRVTLISTKNFNNKKSKGKNNEIFFQFSHLKTQKRIIKVFMQSFEPPQTNGTTLKINREKDIPWIQLSNPNHT